MNIDNMISEYENERSSLIFSLRGAAKNPERLEELKNEIKELDEILKKLKEEKKTSKTNYSNINKTLENDFER